MFKGVEFADPYFLYLLLLIPVLAGWYFFRLRKNSAFISFSSTEGFERSKKSLRLHFIHALMVFRLLALTLLIIVLSRPQTHLRRQDVHMEGIDIVIAMDISGSMLAQDFKPDRLQASKEVAIEFVDGRPDDRIGLVIFSGEAFTQCPLTTDHAVLKNLFADIRSGMIDDGTALGDGLATAVNRLKESKAVSKVIILLTDGVNNMGSLDPVSSAEIAKLFGIRIYTIGVGSMGMAPYPVQTPFGIQLQSMKVEIDEPLLKEVAGLTDGKYFRATSNEKLRQIYKEIDKMEKSKIDITEFRRNKEEFIPFLILALAFLTLEMILRNTLFRNIP